MEKQIRLFAFLGEVMTSTILFRDLLTFSIVLWPYFFGDGAKEEKLSENNPPLEMVLTVLTIPQLYNCYNCLNQGRLPRLWIKS